MRFPRAFDRLACVLALSLLCSCGAGALQPAASPAEQVRAEGPASTDPEVVGKWLLAELLSPQGNVKQAQKARERLESLKGTGLYASLARLMDDEAHGHPTRASVASMQLLQAARRSSDPIAPMAAWYASNRLLHLRSSAQVAWDAAPGFVQEAIDNPQSLGWRARGELIEWWAFQAYRQGKKDVLETVSRYHGCQGAVRIAGPFGRDTPADRHRSFEPEKPGSWPARFRPDPNRGNVEPRVLKTERHGCEVSADESTLDGIFYAETFIDLNSPQNVLLAVQGARSIWVDDVRVLERDSLAWGIWPKFGVQLSLEAGRHRIVARLENPSTSVRVLRPDGTPLPVTSSDNPTIPYVTTPPTVLADPNVIDRFIGKGDVVRPTDDITTFLAAYLAHVEGQDDVASVLMEPLVNNLGKAAPLSLLQQAMVVTGDPIFPEGEARDVARELHTKVLEKDPQMWRSKHWLAVDGAQKKGMPQVARELRALLDAFPEVPNLGQQLANVYDELGWNAERSALVTDLAKRFADDDNILTAYISVLEASGQSAEADRVTKRVLELDPDSELLLDRALRRRDYDGAIKELKRISAIHPDRKSLVDRLQVLLTRAGKSRESFEQLEKAIKKKPQDGAARLALADARYASGDANALRNGIAESIQAGANFTEMANALELLEGSTELEPYRLNPQKVIAEYEKAATQMDGSAVRVLDYGVTWVHPDGSSRMLEHEIIRVQSQEAISKLAEQRIPRGLALRLRVIKKGGQVLEPEFVSDKPTVTMPHLEVGDYIETESITTQAGDGQGGVSYVGPHWFFREQDIAYWRSEFVVISPKDRPLTLETYGAVPEPSVEQDGMLIVRKWRVDKSEAAPVEPSSVPMQELLPSIRVGWGVSVERKLSEAADTLAEPTVADPRLRRIAQRIVQGVPASQSDERARLLYRWVLANVQDGEERDPRQIIIGKSGQLDTCFIYLTQLLQIPTELVVVRNRLDPPSVGPMAEAEAFDNLAIRLKTNWGERWMTVHDRFTPFGYLPAELRGQPGYRLVQGLPKITTSSEGSVDGELYEGHAELRPNGTATVELARSFSGRNAIRLRSELQEVPTARRRDAIEAELLAPELPGSSLVDLSVKAQDELDKPLTLQMSVQAPDFTRRENKTLVLSPPFSPRIAQAAALPTRKTPMLISIASRLEVRLRITLPEGASLAAPLVPVELRDGDRQVKVHDRLEGRTLILDRVYDIPAGRIPIQAYGAFQSFARAADEATHRDIVINVP